MQDYIRGGGGRETESGEGRWPAMPVLLMALTVFVDMAGFGLILPILPFWAQRLGAGPMGVGLLLTLYAVAQFVFTPLMGRLSDRYGRRPVIAGALLIEALAYLLTALAGSLWILLLARFVGGLGASNLGSAQAVVADTTPERRRAGAMGLIGAAIGLGFIVGPAMGGALTLLHPAAPFWAGLGLSLLNAGLVWALLPETRRAQDRGDGSHRPPLATLMLPRVAQLAGVALLSMLAFSAMEAVYPLYSQVRFGWQGSQNGYVFAYVGVLLVLVQGGLAGRLASWAGERAVLVGGLALLATGLGLLAFPGGAGLMLAALGILSIGYGMAAPASSALASFVSPPGRAGEVLGLIQAASGLGQAAGPVAAGLLFAQIGPGAPFLLGAALAVLAVVTIVIRPGPHRGAGPR